MKEMSKKKKVLLVVGVLGILTLLIGVSYAYWMLTFTQDTENLVNSGCFKIEFTEQNPISLDKAYPMSDIDGMKNTPYTFTIQNVCDSSATFQINLESLVPSGKVLPDNYIKTNLSEGTTNRITTKLLDEIQTETTINGAVKAYKLYTGILDPNEIKEFNLRLWMDEDVEATEDSMNASYSGKVSIIASYYEDNRGTLKAIAFGTKTEFWGYKDKIIKVVMEDSINPKETELTWDVSSEQNGSVMSYLVPNEGEEELYTLYLQSEGGIKANPNSNYLFWRFTNLLEIEGIEYFDTINVTNMYYMFNGCISLTSLNLSNFDTSKVTNMQQMFFGCSSLASLDLSNFDTSSVTDMMRMFSGCSSLTSLDLSTFDTRKVTNMMGMFYNCSSLTSLDLSTFDTSQVMGMSSMFDGCSSLTSLDVSHFDTSKVTNMSSMFSNCNSLTGLDLSSFDTSSVTKMYMMFRACSNLTSLDLSSFNTSNVTDMAYMFWGSSSLTNLDLSSFDTSSVTNMSMMFSSMSSTATIKVKDATVQNWVLTSSNGRPSSWTTENVIVVS